MNKLFVTLLASAMIVPAFAQKKMISKAKTALIEPADLKEAQTSIEAAMGNDETASNPYTFVIAGQVYKAIYDAEVKKRMLNQGADQAKIMTSLVNSVNSYTNAAELEQIPDEKGKTTDKYDKDIRKAFKALGDPLIAEGYEALKKGDDANALKLFEGYMSIPNCTIMKDEPLDTTYNTVQFLAINAAMRKKDYGKAIKYMYELKESNYYKCSTVYEWLVDALQAKNDTARSLDILAEGLKKFPTDQYMIGKQVNYYIDHGQHDKAIEYLDNAIKANPNSPDYLNVKGDLFLAEKNYEQALGLYEKASQLDPKNIAAVEGMGVAYASQGVAADSEADKLKNNTAFNKARLAAEENFYQKAVSYLEKAQTMYAQPNKDNLYWLGVVYSRLKQGDKLKKVMELKKTL